MSESDRSVVPGRSTSRQICIRGLRRPDNGPSIFHFLRKTSARRGSAARNEKMLYLARLVIPQSINIVKASLTTDCRIDCLSINTHSSSHFNPGCYRPGAYAGTGIINRYCLYILVSVCTEVTMRCFTVALPPEEL
ncbi:hypothetical protein J6590_027196 [Homalodisca vitripennis]|nr:hypothetical protein J6590_027196 [Homalodisca vitripennis]